MRPLPHIEFDLIRLLTRKEFEIDAMSEAPEPPSPAGRDRYAALCAELKLLEEVRLAIRQATKAAPPIPMFRERLGRYLNTWTGACVAGGFGVAALAYGFGVYPLVAILGVAALLSLVAIILAFNDGVRK